MPKRKKDIALTELKDTVVIKKPKNNSIDETKIDLGKRDCPAVSDINFSLGGSFQTAEKVTNKRKTVNSRKKTSAATKRRKDRERKRQKRSSSEKSTASELLEMRVKIDACYSKTYGVEPLFECNKREQVKQNIREGNELQMSYLNSADESKSSDSDRKKRRRDLYRKRYHEDPDFREKKQNYSRTRYHQDVMYRQLQDANKSKRYRQDREYRDKRKMQNRQLAHQRYELDNTCQEKKKEYSALKYRTDARYRQLKISLSAQKYRNCCGYRYYRMERSVRKYKENTQHRIRVQAASLQKYRENLIHRHQVKDSSLRKYKEDPIHRHKVKVASVRKYKDNPVHRHKVKVASVRKYKDNPVHRHKVKVAGVRKYKEDPKHQQKVKEKSLQKYKHNAAFRHNVKIKLCEKYSKSSAIKSKKILLVKKRRANQRQNKKNIALFFLQQIRDGPVCICCVCHKFKFRKQVILCNIDKYQMKSEKSHTMAFECIDYKFSSTCDCQGECQILDHNKIWICFTCHRHLLKGQMPADAVANNLKLPPIPNELKHLNYLEQQLLSLRIPFMKLISLPKGGQKGIIGPCVSVPTDIQKTTKVLPRYENDSQLIRIKLKRKLAYKGYSQYEYVSPFKMQQALHYLVQNNPCYRDINFDQNWTIPFAETNSSGDSSSQNVNDQIEVEQEHKPEKIGGHGDSDLDDDDPALKDKPLPFDTCLQPADIGQDILDQHFDDIFCIAPSEGKTPVSMLKEEGNEAMSFPALFPDGHYTYDEKRSVKLTRLKYFHARILNAECRFANDTQYLFYAQYLSELQQVVSQVSIALRKGTSKDSTGKDITADMLKDKNEVKHLLKTDQGYKFLTPVRGTPPYWQSTLKDLFAMIRQLGIPTWFCTFSAADMRWSEIINILLKQQGSNLCDKDLDWVQKCELLRTSAVRNSVLFDHRFHTLLNSIIVGKEVIGKVKDYFYRVEFQQRGSPHTHCLFWIEDAPLIDKDDDNTVCSFIDRYVTCKLPTEEEDAELHEMVNSVQQHSKGHSKTCKKKGTTCRFNFPRPPSNRTFISRSQSVTDPSNDLAPHQIMNKAKETLQTLWTVINNADLDEITTTDLFAAAGITQDQFEEASNILTKRTSVILKRAPKDVWINQYSPDLLHCWNANMDIQYVTDAYSCVMYIISYISKAEREMGMVLEDARKEAAEGNLDAQNAMKRIGGAYFHQREVSAQEAAYRVCGLHLKESSRKVQFIPVGKDPIRMSKPLSLIQRQRDKEEDIWMPTVLDRYKSRPFGKEFETLCLASFCSLYRVLASSQVPNDLSKASNVYELQNDLGYIQKRTRSDAAVIRYARFSQQKDPELYFKSILQLFLPYRDDLQIKPQTFSSYEDFYSSGAVKITQESPTINVRAIVDENKQKFEINAEALEDAQEIFDKIGPLEDAWATLSPQSELDRLECEMQKTNKSATSEEDNFQIPELDANKPNSLTDDHSIELSRHILSTEDALPLLRSLNSQQKQVFYRIRQWCLDKVNGKHPEPFQLFITGGAGTGKSHLIKCIEYETNKILSPSASNPDDTVVLLTAPTGTAAFNISGTTLHQAFALPKYLSLPYQHMRDENLNTLRCKLQSLQILIIDEISMVGQKLFTYIHERLRQIKQSGNGLFGNICIIAVGDFYQLPPVKDKALYDLRPQNYYSLWSLNFSVVELKQIMRQKDDVSFAELLNRLRIKQKGAPLDDNDVTCLKACQDKPADIDSLHIFGTNKEVDEHNMKMLEVMCTESLHITAQDFDRDATSGKMKKRDTPYSTSSDYLPSELVLGKGARVMLVRNVDISDGLVNGVVGTIFDIMLNPHSSSHSVSVSVIFDNKRVGLKQRHSVSSRSSNQTNSVVITFLEEVLHNNAIRHQLPLRLSWACTIHKVQGITTDKIFISFKKIFSPGMAYVGLSRVTTIMGLAIEDFQEDKIYCSEQVSEAIHKMPSFLHEPQNTMFSQGTTNILLHNVQGLLPHIQDLRANADITGAHFLCLTEIWMQNSYVSPLLHNFEFHRKTRFNSYAPVSAFFKNLKHMKHGGVGIFNSNMVSFNEVVIKQCNIEFLAFKITEISTTVVLIYRPDIYKTSIFVQQLQVLLKQLPHDSPSLVVGDFNQDLLKENSTILNFMKDYGYQQIVDTPTTDGNTLIDHVYLKGNIKIDISVLQTYYSYHNMISLKVSLPQKI